MISARIIADSLAPSGSRLTTFVCVYPRFIHSEVMTHRVFSRNAASSRAIPVSRMISMIKENPAMPVYWGKNQKGMQADEELPLSIQLRARAVWHEAMLNAVAYAEKLLDLGVHKQIANRILEPFAHMTTIISATDWGNFWGLRAHKDAQPEFQLLAFLMLREWLRASPKPLAEGEWHLPFADQHISAGLDLPSLLKITTARCARVSYLNFEGNIEYEKDFALHDSLLESGHVSPAEHPARAESTLIRSGNFCGFTQYRKTLKNEIRNPTNRELEEVLLAWEQAA